LYCGIKFRIEIAMRTIKDIITDAGGPKAITAEANDAFAIDAVYKWPTIGIPDRHWPILIKLAATSPDELFEANRLARTTPLAASESAA